MRLVVPMMAAALLAGCSLFSSTHSWSKPGTTPEQARADLDTCRQIARADQDVDHQIDQDAAATSDNGQGAVDTELSQNMSNQRSDKRFDDVVDDCMRQMGYAPAQ